MSTKVTPETPWLGLRYFSEDDRDYFFGRTAELNDLHERVMHKPLTILFGQSGIGKTSLLRAGLVPKLRAERFLPVLIRLHHRPDSGSYQKQVLSALAMECLSRRNPTLPSTLKLAAPKFKSSTLWEVFHDPMCGFLDPEGKPRANPVLVFDQFEEIFTLGQARREEAAAFRGVLSGLVENRVPDDIRRAIEDNDDLAERLRISLRACKVLVSLREDFLHQLERWRRDMPSLMENRVELRRLTGSQALDAVVKPGKLRCAELATSNQASTIPIVSEETGAAIVRFVARAGNDLPLAEIDTVPPLLSLVCAELNDQRLAQPAPPAQISTTQLEGSAEGILERFYSACFARSPKGLRELVEDRLLSPDGYRQSITTGTIVSALAEHGVGSQEAEAAIAALVDARLLSSEERGGTHRVELTHDILTGVVRSSRDTRRERERRRKRFVLAATTLGLAVLVAAVSVSITIWALGERKQADAQRARAEEQETLAQKRIEQASRNDYATASEQFARGEWRKGIAYLGRSLGFDPNNKLAAFTLWQQVVYGGGDRDELPYAVLQHRKAVTVAAFSTDGARVVTASLDGTARLWNAASGLPLGEPFRHEVGVNFAALSPDGTRLVTASSDKSARLWDAASGKPLGERMQHGDVIRCAGFSPDGSRVVTASWDKTARLWDATNGQPLSEPLRHEDRVFSAAFSPDGSRVVTASLDKTARLWDAASGQPLGEPLRHEGPVFSATFSPDGRRVITASSDKTARLWDAVNGQPLGEPLRHENPVLQAAFNPDGTRVVTVSNDNAARLWDATSSQRLGEPLRHEGEIRGAAFSPDGMRVVTACADNTARLWNAASGKPLGEPFRHEGLVLSAAFSPDGTRVVTASWDGTARLWDTASGKRLGEPLRHKEKVLSAAFSPDGRHVVTISDDKSARLWDAASGKSLGEPLRHKGRINYAAFSPDGTRVVTASDDKTAQLWDAASGQPLGEPLRHKDQVNNAAFSPDGSRVVTSAWDNTARLWDVASGKPLGGPLQHLAIRSAAFSPDGTRVVTVGLRTAQLWDAASGQPLGEPLRHEDQVNNAAFSPDGSRVVTSAWDNTARLWDVASGKPLGEPLQHEAWVEHVEFSPDSTCVVTASLDNTARLWSATSGQPLGKPLRHEGIVRCATFSPDGTCVVTASDDKTARLWDVTSGKALGEPLRHDDRVNSASFSPDGARVVTASDDKTARLWDVPHLTALSGAVDRWSSIEAASGFSITADGELRPLSMLERLARRGPADASIRGNPDWERLVAWWLERPARRTASPVSATTPRELADRQLNIISADSVREVLALDPGHPLIQIAAAQIEKDETRAEFLRSYSVQRLPADTTVCARAAAMLAAQEDFTRALQAADKALSIDAKNLSALQTRLTALGMLGHEREAAELLKQHPELRPKEAGK